MDISDSSASARPAVTTCLTYLDQVDSAYADRVRTSLLPLFDYLPTDRTGLAWAAPAITAYFGLSPAVRYEMSARINDLAERMQAMRVVYGDGAEVAYRCAVTARHTDAFLAAAAAGATRTYQGANIRDAAIAENVEWILQREERIVIAAANGHIQRWPFSAPPVVNHELTMAGEHLAAALGKQMVVIATCFGGGELMLHRPIPGAPPGHTELFTEEVRAHPGTLDALLSGAGSHVLDLRKVDGPIADQLAATTSMMNGGQPQPINPLAAFDAVAFIDTVTPWHTFLGQG
jgi:erythromycin esterase